MNKRRFPIRNSQSAIRNTISGFTLIELLIVVIILGLLASLVTPRLAGRTEEARRQAAMSDIHGGLSLALDLFEADNGTYPEKLEDLIQRPEGTTRWKGPYLKRREVPRDPWGSPYQYRYPTEGEENGYELYSVGPDKEEGTRDDIR